MKEGVYVKKYISSRFQGVEGGLFTKVTKADVGDNFASMEAKQSRHNDYAFDIFPDIILFPFKSDKL